MRVGTCPIGVWQGDNHRNKTPIKFMEIKDVLYDNVDSVWENEEDCPDATLIKNDYFGKDAVVANIPAWRVKDKGLVFVEGVYCSYDDETDGYDPDWGITLIYEDTDDLDLDKFVYFEQGMPSVAIHNYLTMKNQNN